MFNTPATFYNPVNKVQHGTILNRAAGTYSYSPALLAEMFEAGAHIDVDVFIGFIPNSCHQELELHFVENKLNY